MKISLFLKPSMMKVYFFFILFYLIAGIPTQANASFFNDLVASVIGLDHPDQNTNTEVNDVVHNSQNVPLLETSIDGDKNQAAITILGGDTLSSDNIAVYNSPYADLEKNASSSKIDVYTVKKGDTLKSIAKKFKVTENTIIYSNGDIKKSDLLKVGQVLAILPVKNVPDKITDKTMEKKVVPKKKDIVDDTEDISTDKQEQIKEETKKEVENTVTTTTPVVVKEAQTDENQTQSTSSGQPSGNISSGYIWPFPAGVGRVSQGLHADQAYDFAAPANTPIYAVSNGTVLIAHPTGYNGGYGHYVVINFDDGRQAIFGHMNKVVAEAGDVVKQGDIIGYVGSTGRSTGPHTHIGFRGTLGNPYVGLKVNSTDFVKND